jgi:hypothetical protein
MIVVRPEELIRLRLSTKTCLVVAIKQPSVYLHYSLYFSPQSITALDDLTVHLKMKGLLLILTICITLAGRIEAFNSAWNQNWTDFKTLHGMSSG